MRTVLLLCLCWAGAAWGVGTPDAPLRVMYQERPPYYMQQGADDVTGLVAAPTAEALRRAGIAFRWERLPSQRQLLLIQSGDAPVCGLGWFRTPEREALGKYSLPVYRDQAMAALVRASYAPAPGASMESLLSSPQWRLLTKEGYSYGPQIDAWLGSLPVRRVTTGSEAPQLVLMLLAERADWMLVAPEEADALMAQHPAGQLQLVRFADVRAGQHRYLYCNRAVPDSLLRRLNDALPRQPSGAPAGAMPAAPR